MSISNEQFLQLFLCWRPSLLYFCWMFTSTCMVRSEATGLGSARQWSHRREISETMKMDRSEGQTACHELLVSFYYFCSCGWIPKPKDELGASKRWHGCERLWFCKTFRSFSSTKEMLRLLQLTPHVFVQTTHSDIDRWLLLEKVMSRRAPILVFFFPPACFSALVTSLSIVFRC